MTRAKTGSAKTPRSSRLVGGTGAVSSGSWELRPTDRWQFVVMLVGIATSPIGLAPHVAEIFIGLAGLCRGSFANTLPLLVVPAMWSIHLALRLRSHPSPRWLLASLVVLIGSVIAWGLLALTMTQDSWSSPSGWQRFRGGLPINCPQNGRYLTAVAGTVMLANITLLSAAVWLLLRRQPAVRRQQISWYAFWLGPIAVSLARLHILFEYGID